MGRKCTKGYGYSFGFTFNTISYHDYKEDFYHAFLAGIFAGAGYVVESNKEHGEGRSDIVIYDDYEGKVAIFEAKKISKIQKI